MPENLGVAGRSTGEVELTATGAFHETSYDSTLFATLAHASHPLGGKPVPEAIFSRSNNRDAGIRRGRL